MMASFAERRRQILNVRQLARCRGCLKIRGQLRQLRGAGGIATGCIGLRGRLQIAGDLLRDLCVFGWVRLLELLQLAHYLGQRRKRATIRLSADAACAGRACCRTDALQRASQGRFNRVVNAVRAAAVRAAANRRRQILNVRQLAGCRCLREICRQLRELRSTRAVSVRSVALRGRLQAGGNLLRHLRIFGRVRLLQLLQLAQQFRQRGKLAAVRYPAHTACAAARRRRRVDALQSAAEGRFDVAVNAA